MVKSDLESTLHHLEIGEFKYAYWAMERVKSDEDVLAFYKALSKGLGKFTSHKVGDAVPAVYSHSMVGKVTQADLDFVRAMERDLHAGNPINAQKIDREIFVIPPWPEKLQWTVSDIVLFQEVNYFHAEGLEAGQIVEAMPNVSKERFPLEKALSEIKSKCEYCGTTNKIERGSSPMPYHTGIYGIVLVNDDNSKYISYLQRSVERAKINDRSEFGGQIGNHFVFQVIGSARSIPGIKNSYVEKFIYPDLKTVNDAGFQRDILIKALIEENQIAYNCLQCGGPLKIDLYHI